MTSTAAECATPQRTIYILRNSHKNNNNNISSNSSQSTATKTSVASSKPEATPVDDGKASATTSTEIAEREQKNINNAKPNYNNNVASDETLKRLTPVDTASVVRRSTAERSTSSNGGGSGGREVQRQVNEILRPVASTPSGRDSPTRSVQRQGNDSSSISNKVEDSAETLGRRRADPGFNQNGKSPLDYSNADAASESSVVTSVTVTGSRVDAEPATTSIRQRPEAVRAADTHNRKSYRDPLPDVGESKSEDSSALTRSVRRNVVENRGTKRRNVAKQSVAVQAGTVRLQQQQQKVGVARNPIKSTNSDQKKPISTGPRTVSQNTQTESLTSRDVSSQSQSRCVPVGRDVSIEPDSVLRSHDVTNSAATRRYSDDNLGDDVRTDTTSSCDVFVLGNGNYSSDVLLIDQLVVDLKREVRLLRQENHYLRQQLMFPVKPKGRLQLDNDERFLQLVRTKLGERTQDEPSQQALWDLLHENIIENDNLRSENASLQSSMEMQQSSTR